MVARFPILYSGNLYCVVDFVPSPSLGEFEEKPAIMILPPSGIGCNICASFLCMYFLRGLRVGHSFSVPLIGARQAPA